MKQHHVRNSDKVRNLLVLASFSPLVAETGSTSPAVGLKLSHCEIGVEDGSSLMITLFREKVAANGGVLEALLV